MGASLWIPQNWEPYRPCYRWKVWLQVRCKSLALTNASKTLHSITYRLFMVNGQPVFIRGGNWILSDGLLRLSKKRYQTDIKFHADMNFNMLRCWGGGLAERPEFYHYCDVYGLLVSFAFSPLQQSLHSIDFIVARPMRTSVFPIICFVNCYLSFPLLPFLG